MRSGQALVFFMDGSAVEIPITPSTLVQEALLAVARKIGLKTMEGWGLFEFGQGQRTYDSGFLVLFPPFLSCSFVCMYFAFSFILSNRYLPEESHILEYETAKVQVSTKTKPAEEKGE